MRIDYAISLWNFTHYANASSLERVLAWVRAAGYGIELWGSWRDERDLYDPAVRGRLRAALDGMPVSLHTAGAPTLDMHRKQVDAAAELGAQVVVLHSDDLYLPGTKTLDVELAGRATAYARAAGVRLALENGQLPFLAEAIRQVADLDICLDVGHVYLTPELMAAFLAAFKHRIIHLHLQDLVLEPEFGLRSPGTGRDHYTLGSGGIPTEDWNLLIAALREVDFRGTAVFEIQPRNPLQTAALGRAFMGRLCSE